MIEIRKVQVTDFSAIADIYADNVRHGTGTFDLEPPTPQTLMARWHELRGMNLPYIVATQDDTVIGFAYASPFRQRPAYRYGVEDSVYIHPDHKGKGAGTALLKALLEACTDAGYYMMFAVIGDAANTASIRLHEAMGFDHTGSLPRAGYKFDRWIDVVFMSKALRDTTTPAEGTGWVV